jgi:hypothetical protein
MTSDQHNFVFSYRREKSSEADEIRAGNKNSEFCVISERPENEKL